jgi:glutamyl-tRNA synthetase
MVKVRFAPSPTGHLHIGGLRAALFNYYFAKQNNGKFIIRIEDTDASRNKQEYTDAIIKAFQWCAITSDEPIQYQSQRSEIYEQYIQKLLASGDAYYSEETDENGVTGTVIKCKVDKTKPHISFHDIIRGEIIFPMSEIDDFIIVRSNGTPLYNFVVVVDDIEMQITHIIRGEEHLANTPKQIILYEAFKATMPHVAHLPLILGPDRKKLSKRDAATSVIDYKTAGFLPEALCMYLLRLGWSYGDQEIFTYEEILRYFKLENVHHSGAIFDIQKLKSINNMFLKKISPHIILEEIKKLYHIVDNDAIAEAIIALYLPRAHTLQELAQYITIIIDGPQQYDFMLLQKHNLEEKTVATIANILVNLLHTHKDLSIDQTLKDTQLNQYDKPTLYTALRFALLGTTESPSILSIMNIMGRDLVTQRLKAVQS